MTPQPPSRLRRSLGLRGAVVVGLAAMLGTGVFAVWTPALELAGPLLFVALGIAALSAVLNAVSTVRLARVLPESGGAYAYGRAYVGRPAGLLAGYAFVIGKSASAGAAAITIGAYAWPGQERIVGVVAIAVALALDLRGVAKSVRVSGVLVVCVIAVLLALCGTWAVDSPSFDSLVADPSALEVLGAAGLVFVAFAGYARITVLGEEVRDPAHTIPRAVIISFAIVTVVYVVVAVTVMSAAGAGVTMTAAPLEAVARASGGDGLALAVRIAAVVAAGAVLLSLLAGIGRTLFAMGAGGDAPSALAAVSERTRVPHRAEVVAAVLALAVVLVGGIAFALAVSAGTVMTYYAVAHLAAWRTGARVVPVLGLTVCAAIVAGLVGTALA